MTSSELILAGFCNMYLAVVGRVRCSSCNELGPEVAVLEDPIVVCPKRLDSDDCDDNSVLAQSKGTDL